MMFQRLMICGDKMAKDYISGNAGVILHDQGKMVGSVAPLHHDSLNIFDGDGHVRPLRDIETAVIDHALQVCGSRGRAARSLGIGRSSIYRKMGSGKPRAEG
jgi:DNA-binding NtrC family response regulator